MRALARAAWIVTFAATATASGCKKPVGDATCTKDSDCGKGDECIFTERGCTAPRGTCTKGGTTCKVPTPHCTCDDRTETACDAHSPFKDHGPCERDRSDGRPCTKEADCGPNAAVCVFEPGCDAPHGTCKSVERLNHCKVNGPYCTCASETHTACEIGEPYRSRGACADAGASRSAGPRDR